MSYGEQHLQYLQGSRRPLVVSSNVPCISANVNNRRLWRITGVGVTSKYTKELEPEVAPVNLPSMDVLMALYGFGIPVAFLVRGMEERISVDIGTFLTDNVDANRERWPQILSERQQMLSAVLQGIYRGVKLHASDPRIPQPDATGLVIGIPSLKPVDGKDRLLPLDRLVRGLRGANWGCLILASPVPQPLISDLRLKAAEEVKAVRFFKKTQPFEDMLSQFYDQLLESTVKDYTVGLAVGAWRTSAYLFGDNSGASRLGALWQGVFSGEQSLHMPLRYARSRELPTFVAEWRISEQKEQTGPGLFRHEYAHQTILTCEQLATYIHLPREEHNGFAIDLIPRFDIMPPPPPKKQPILVGQIVADRGGWVNSYSSISGFSA